ncbi:hypothetical protein Tcur_3664 [Thermomonospora curvata DSM 43183]|uniref:Uncharacterized protein n=1 Tax=Thermomonospora curvata (strain ATCC 19995 / DSM 43183 / JCM 3096 / KCTC 9072 / NBRC 15933 / NCIMB 10081 / Henssen B9) TaxID=471852 RepID=D1ACD8_THECD|nr:hypothetical protein Tcur_3664 [Thermomonospora curvata DSM 43183]
MWIGTPDCPDKCGCYGGVGLLTALRAVVSVVRDVLRAP